MMKRLLAGLLCAIMLLVSCVALADTNPNTGMGYYTGTSEKGAISVQIGTMSKMNPILQTYSNEFSIDRHIFDNLVKLSAEDNSVVPAAAESWETSEDGLTWTFHLRPGMKWVNSAGEVVADVTANDFVFGWSELLNPTNAAEYYAFATVFKNAQAYYNYASGVEGAAEVTLDQVGFHRYSFDQVSWWSHPVLRIAGITSCVIHLRKGFACGLSLRRMTEYKPDSLINQVSP